MATKVSLWDAMALRRSRYALVPQSPTSDERIIKIVQHAVTQCPSPFNVQSARAIILLRGEHEKFWTLAEDSAVKTWPLPAYQALKSKLAEYKSGYGTVLWFEDQDSISAVEKQLGPARWDLVKEKMPQWSEHSSGMHQYAVWTALSAEGFGCNLQHYNPIVDEGVREQWKVPSSWALKAQLVFGKPVGPPREKTVIPPEDRVFIYKS
ncbi:uncharacterized protein PV09_05897 [Verruconis gallopava]|uniref:Nitroreductase domain-containing protein n=1 Tax=Verruconis gallopava TaxID=253628 RepID=A0A0D2A8B8_9PEZI|nr:uncharacterized protein PV09_05897 [Verruconis gallopava]KIW02840.1 hypothetical protein PV09_05897 [Verruconis gallopava]